MLTRLARLALLAEALLLLLVGYWLHVAHGWTLAGVAAGAILASLALRLGFVAGTMTIAALAARGRPAAERLGWAATLRLLFAEARAVLASSYVNIPFEQLVAPAERVPAPSERVPGVLVHGYFGNRGYFAHLLRWLEAQGVTPVFAPNFPGTFATIERFADELASVVERITAATGQPRVILVCHSMGGLAARLYVAAHGADRVAKLITIASPHAGTVLAAFAPGANAVQMRRASGFLQRLQRDEAMRSAGPETTSIYSLHDNLVSPQATSRLGWARNIALPALGHITILMSPQLFGVLLEELRGAGVRTA